MDTDAIVLKTDSRGRVRTPPERRAALLAEFARSGLSATKFAALAGVRYQTFATWVQQQKRRGPGTPAKGPRPVRFTQVVPVISTAQAQPRAVRVLLPGGAVIELTGPAQVPLLAQLIQALV
jgi:transposase-like protein